MRRFGSAAVIVAEPAVDGTANRADRHGLSHATKLGEEKAGEDEAT